jgi:acyl carrier protein
VRGEIYIGGDGLARGYVGRAGQTAERFVPDPYSQVGGERVYATGDIGSYGEDGRIEFVGRRDGQVKVRGFRIETGEIEAALSQHPGLREVVVIARANPINDKDLVAYVVKDSGELTDDELQNFLAQRLPVYMIPTRFVTLEKLPLTPNGKIDRAALPAPEKMRPALQEEFIAPKTPVEKLIAEIWCEVLDIDQVGINDNFFKLGAHSLLATKVATRLREAFQQEISLGKMFEAPTVAEIAAVIEEGQAHPRRINDFEIERLPRGNEDMAQVLAELAKLSEHEAQSLLRTETHANSSAK